MVNFRLLYRRALTESYKAGKVSKHDYEILLDAYRNPRRHNAKGVQIDLLVEAEKCAKKRSRAIDWAGIIKWLKENWLTILKLFLSLLPLFLMVNEGQPEA